MISFIVKSISQLDRGGYMVVLSEKRKFKGKRSRKDRWSSSDDWYPGDEPQMPFGHEFFHPSNFCLPVDTKTFADSGLFVGAEVELSMKVVSNYVR